MNKKYIALALVAIFFSACGSSSSDTKNDDGKGDIDLVQYFPSGSIDKIFSSQIKSSNENPTPHSEYQEITVTGETITTTIKGKVTERVIFTDTNITTTDLEDNETDTMYRHVDIGDKLFTKSMNSEENTDLGKTIVSLKSVCKLKSKESEFKKDAHTYSGDLLKIECITEGTMIYDVKPSLLNVVSSDLNGSHEYYDKSYIYLKKGLGSVAEIDDNCLVAENLPIIDDRKSESECSLKSYEYKFYLP
jgi:hypothetical protein